MTSPRPTPQRQSAEAANADAFAQAMDEMHERALPPPRTLTGHQVRTLLDALHEADAALNKAAGSKLYSIRRAALDARDGVIRAWALLKEPPAPANSGIMRPVPTGKTGDSRDASAEAPAASPHEGKGPAS